MNQLAPLAWPFTILVGSVFIFILAVSGRVRSLTAGKDGVSLDLNKVNLREGSRHAMDRRIHTVDDRLDLAAKRATKSLRRTMVHAVSTATNCAITKRAMGSSLLDPLFDAADENDFKTHLSSNSRDAYIDAKVQAIREYYDELSEATSTGCASSDGENDLPPWEEAEKRIRDVVARWAYQIGEAVKTACREKIDIYREYRPQFEAANDKYFLDVVDSCIAKNQKYIEQLGGEP